MSLNYAYKNMVVLYMQLKFVIWCMLVMSKTKFALYEVLNKIKMVSDPFSKNNLATQEQNLKATQL